jgi:hypothetical protein
MVLLRMNKALPFELNRKRFSCPLGIFSLIRWLALTILLLGYVFPINANEHGFDISIFVYAPLRASQYRGLVIPFRQIPVDGNVVRLLPDDEGAAKLEFETNSDETVIYSMADISIELKGENGTIVIDQFDLKGDIQQLESKRTLTSVKIGATATIPLNALEQSYEADAAFMLVYQ